MLLPELSKHTEKLIYFYKVTELGSLQATSRKMGISAPTISYAIKELEAVVSTSLFERSKDGMKVTRAGEYLRIFCEKLFRDLDSLENQFKRNSLSPVTHLRIGTFPSIAIYFWPYMLGILKEEPLLSMSIMTNRSSKIIESLIKKEIDVAITVEGKQTPELIRHELYRDDYAFYAAAEFQFESVSLQEGHNQTLLYLPDAPDQDGVTLKHHLFSTKLKFKEIFEIDSFEVIAQFAIKNYGIGILPRKVGDQYKSQLKEVKLEGIPHEPLGSHRFFLSYRKDLEVSQRLMSLVLESAYQSIQVF